MKRARFVTAARREFLAEVAYYDETEPGLGARFAAAVEEATARALAFPLAGSPSPANTRRVMLKTFPFLLYYRPDHEAFSCSPWPTTHAAPATGRRGPVPADSQVTACAS